MSQSFNKSLNQSVYQPIKRSINTDQPWFSGPHVNNSQLIEGVRIFTETRSHNGQRDYSGHVGQACVQAALDPETSISLCLVLAHRDVERDG